MFVGPLLVVCQFLMVFNHIALFRALDYNLLQHPSKLHLPLPQCCLATDQPQALLESSCKAAMSKRRYVACCLCSRLCIHLPQPGLQDCQGILAHVFAANLSATSMLAHLHLLNALQCDRLERHDFGFAQHLCQIAAL